MTFTRIKQVIKKTLHKKEKGNKSSENLNMSKKREIRIV